MGISFVYPVYLWLLLLIPLTAGLALLGRRALTRRRFWGGLALRSLLLALIVLALAGIQLRLRSDTLTVVFVLDVSDSIPVEQQAQGEAFIRQAVAEMPSGDRAGVVVFGQDALVERLASVEQNLPAMASAPVTSQTNIAGALQLALALFPDEGAKRLVLLSDGRENLNQAIEQAELAAAHGAELTYVPLGDPESEAEVLVEGLSAPADVRLGQNYDLEVNLRSSLATQAALRVLADGALIDSRELQLEPGTTEVRIPVEADEAGFRRFQVQILPAEDHRLQNNTASAFTVVHGPPRVLVIEGQPGEAANLVEGLRAAEMLVDVIAPSQTPGTLPELAAYEAVVLANVHAAALPASALEALPAYVRELGKGLLMTGGDQSFGAGGYLRTDLEKALPVDMDVRSRQFSANLALVLAIDKSGSMGRCHCDDPNLNQSYTRAEVGQPKVDIAKEAVMRSASALGPGDYLGVVAFDSQARWALDVSPLPDPLTLERSIGVVQADGQTNMRTGVEAAYAALEGVEARRKHVILMTDGWVRTGELNALASQMQAEGITLSVVAAGEGSAQYLEQLALDGGGRYYPAEDILGVPDIFLKETVKSVGEYIIEEPFLPLPGIPGPALRGLDTAALPALLGYNGTTAKNTARLDLITPRGDPLLATWQYGLGRAAAWTSDLKGQWGREWVRWEGFPRFAAQLVGWTMPAPQSEGLAARASLVEGQAAIELEAQSEDGQPLNFLDAQATILDPELGAQQVPLAQVGPGAYRAEVEANQPGTYLVRLGVNDQNGGSLGQMIMGLVVPYSPEYRAGGIDRGLLSELGRMTGGGQLAEPLAAFVHNLPAADFAREIWRPLLLVAALLFPLDVALRRVIFGPEDWRRARVWAGERLPWRERTTAAPQRRALGQLFQARERARSRRGRDERPAESVEARKADQASAPEPSATKEQPQKTAPPEAPVSSEEAMRRLREAKKRAQDR